MDYDETLPIIIKSKHPKKGEYKEKNWRTLSKKTKKTTKEGEPQGEHQVPKPALITRSISNKKKGKKVPE
jgi:hypothetical protein